MGTTSPTPDPDSRNIMHADTNINAAARSVTHPRTHISRHPDQVPNPARRDVLTRRVRWFATATITYNVIEAVVALTAGAAASSTALIGFGLDSIIEVSSAAAVAWQFSAPDHATRGAREHRALRIIAISFFALAAYVSVQSVRALSGDGEAQPSSVGLVLAALSLAIMPLLSTAQRRAGRELGSASAVADSKQTLLCTYLSAVLLLGLGVNSLLGWSWADPIAALAIAVIAVEEGVQAWRGDGCCAPDVALLPTSATSKAPACSSHRPEDVTGDVTPAGVEHTPISPAPLGRVDCCAAIATHLVPARAASARHAAWRPVALSVGSPATGDAAPADRGSDVSRVGEQAHHVTEPQLAPDDGGRTEGQRVDGGCLDDCCSPSRC